MDVAQAAAPPEIIEPDLPIIDPHHHLGYLYGGRYLVEEFAADLATGHNILATIYVECSAMLRRSGPEEMRTVGEAEFVSGLAAMSDSGSFGPTRICAGFVGAAELSLGDAVDPVLAALDTASGGRLRGIRDPVVWDADSSVNTGSRSLAPRGKLLDVMFQQGVARLAARGLVFDAFLYHPQMSELCSLADALPHVPIAVNHCGGLLGIGPYDREGGFGHWRESVVELAKRPNVRMKLGGLGGRRCGFHYARHGRRDTAEELANLWRPYMDSCIELFGPARCMFESNYQPDRHAGEYATLWNAFKVIAHGCSADEKAALFRETARQLYRIDCGASVPA